MGCLQEHAAGWCHEIKVKKILASECQAQKIATSHALLEGWSKSTFFPSCTLKTALKDIYTACSHSLAHEETTGLRGFCLQVCLAVVHARHSCLDDNVPCGESTGEEPHEIDDPGHTTPIILGH